MEDQELADNEVEFTDNVNDTEEVAIPQEQQEEMQEVKEETQEEIQETENEVQVPEKTETQRVAQRIKEATDKAKEEALNNDKRIQLFNKLAQKSNMPSEEYLKFLDEQLGIDEVKKQHGEIDDTIAKELYSLKNKADEWDKFMQESSIKKEQEAKKQEEYNEFFDFYKTEYGKDVVVEDIPKEVFDMVKKGYTLTNAFIKHQYNEMKKGQAIKEKNQENANSTTGSVTGGGAEEIMFTPEQINNMSPQEMSKYWNDPTFRKMAGLN